MRKVAVVVVVLLCSIFVSASLSAELSRDDQKRAKQMLKGTLWLRIDAPCETGRHPYGIYHKPLIEVSPDSANTDVGNQLNIGWYHAGSTDWSVRVNDSVELDEVEFEDSEAEIEIEGVGDSEGRDSALKFTNINSLADFEAAFARTFAKTPLQDEHPDWSPEVKRAIAARSLLDGMTKRQAFYVVGQPETIEKKADKDVEVEIWTLRQKGMEFGFFGMKSVEPQVSRALRFEGGKLALSNSTLHGSELKLDD